MDVRYVSKTSEISVVLFACLLAVASLKGKMMFQIDKATLPQLKFIEKMILNARFIDAIVLRRKELR